MPSSAVFQASKPRSELHAESSGPTLSIQSFSNEFGFEWQMLVQKWMHECGGLIDCYWRLPRGAEERVPVCRSSSLIRNRPPRSATMRLQAYSHCTILWGGGF